MLYSFRMENLCANFPQHLFVSLRCRRVFVGKTPRLMFEGNLLALFCHKTHVAVAFYRKLKNSSFFVFQSNAATKNCLLF